MEKVALKNERQGSILINTVFIVVLLVMSSFAFMRWAADEAQQSAYELARTQAYYVAQYGVFDRALPSLRTRKPGTLPEAREYFGHGDYNFNGENIGRYTDAYIERVSDRGHDDVFSQLYYFDLTATGTVNMNRNSPFQKDVQVQRKVTMRAKLRSFANYMYLTDNELTEFNEIIWFYQEDTLWGRVHSNDRIGMKNQPMFHGPVSTCSDDFERGSGYNPWFDPRYPPQFEVPAINFPYTAEILRTHAQGAGTYLENMNGTLQTRIEATQGAWEWVQWPLGVPFSDDVIQRNGSYAYGDEVGIFIEGQAEVFGEYVSGAVTVGTEGDMWLIDNIQYAMYTGVNMDVSDLPETIMLGLLSESDIRISATDANGSDNGASAGMGHDRAHIIITAAIIALGESFSFEYQNDLGDTYCHCPPCPNGQGGLDERGAIYLRGSVAQKRRGYVHRSNCGGTGYDKQYEYDFRFDRIPPPYILDAVDDKGNLMFDLVWWQEEPVDD